jgi:hypothetical protein
MKLRSKNYMTQHSDGTGASIQGTPARSIALTHVCKQTTVHAPRACMGSKACGNTSAAGAVDGDTVWVLPATGASLRPRHTRRYSTSCIRASPLFANSLTLSSRVRKAGLEQPCDLDKRGLLRAGCLQMLAHAQTRLCLEQAWGETAQAHARPQRAETQRAWRTTSWNRPPNLCFARCANEE